jgi:RimJ/RimL family protein N-acetyltransferase
VADLHAPGVRVRPNPPARSSWRGVYVLAFEGATVYAPNDLLVTVSAGITASSPDDLLEAKNWLDILPGMAQSVWGPVKHAYLDRVDGLAELAAGRRLNPTDSDALGQLRAALPQQEWVATGFTARTAVMFGILEGDELVAAANLTSGPAVGGNGVPTTEAATDIGYVVHPQARGRGYGLQICALAAKQAISMYGVARYRTLIASPAAVAIAERLGFQEYGRNLVAYLSQSVPDIW